jgi:hypothetical protein
MSDEIGDESEDEGTSGTQLLPLYASHPSAPSKAKPIKVNHLNDIWDEREELFGVNDSDEDEATLIPRPQHERSEDTPLPPKIVVTRS